MKRLSLDLSALSSRDRLAWLAYARFAAGSAGVDAHISVDAQSAPPDDEPFVFVSSSEALSRKLLREFDRIHVAPSAAPGRLDAHIYWDMEVAEFASDDELMEIRQRFRPSRKDVTLLTSVFRGDVFLSGFLENSARLERYPDCEHFLIRAGSPGQEHRALIDHVRAHPGAVYINLQADPGLYEVWNLGARLSTARYLSTANLDDRRSPEHVRRLAGILDENPGIDVVSSTLRISEERNLSWENSSDCPVMFGTAEDRTYGVGELIRTTADGARARNLPHCMPLWRRELHASHGYFDERRYGPSADWEFWLRAGSRGSGFRLIAEPLGLYLKDAASYWRRQGGTGVFDSRILEEYGGRAGASGGTARPKRRPLSRRMNDALELIRASACLEGIAQFLDCIEDERIGHYETMKALVSKAGHTYLGRDDLMNAGLAEGWGEAVPERLFDRVVTLLHGISFEGETARFDTARRVLLFASVDLHEITRDSRRLLLRAFILRKFRDYRAEANLLGRLHREDPKGFWASIQAVYRFDAGIGALALLVSGLRVAGADDLRELQNLNVVYYPAYTGNAYQGLLYRPVIEAGGMVQGIRDLEVLRSMPRAATARNVFHVHWINAIFAGLGPGEFAARAEEFLSRVRDVKARGFEIYWTVHNNLSHESIDPKQEMAFRRALYIHADRVYIHHPMVAEILEWLPGREKLHLVEHGPYDLSSPSPVGRDEARRRIGLGSNDFVLAYMGQIRDYKALDETLPWIFEVLDREPRMKLLVVGTTASEAAGRLLNSRPRDRVILRGERLSGEDLEIHMNAADFGFLSYRDIVTSGSLFHWASCGVPVIGPALGTIPAYLVPSWNGFVYHSGRHLREILMRCLNAPPGASAKLGKNARKMATRLRWEFF